VRNFRKVWEAVCNNAGVPDLLFHDLLRTGVRNVRRLGSSESLAIKVSGHVTSSVFKRYDSTDEADLVEVAARLDAKQNSQAPEIGQSSGKTERQIMQQPEARCPLLSFLTRSLVNGVGHWCREQDLNLHALSGTGS
jgi:hypothetical protein